MAMRFLRASVLIILISIAPHCLAAEAPAKPLSAGRLLALVAGGALPENVVREIQANGLAFCPDDDYRALLKAGGAGEPILNAVNAAAAGSTGPAEGKADEERLQHISHAAQLMKDKMYEEAASELKAALAVTFEEAETGFVMGEVLRLQERWTDAADVYGKVLSEDADFPEAHTKLSYI